MQRDGQSFQEIVPARRRDHLVAVSPKGREQGATKGRIARANQQAVFVGSIRIRWCTLSYVHGVPISYLIVFTNLSACALQFGLCAGIFTDVTPLPFRVAANAFVNSGSRSWIMCFAPRRNPSTGSVRLRAVARSDLPFQAAHPRGFMREFPRRISGHQGQSRALQSVGQTSGGIEEHRPADRAVTRVRAMRSWTTGPSPRVPASAWIQERQLPWIQLRATKWMGAKANGAPPRVTAFFRSRSRGPRHSRLPRVMYLTEIR